MIPCTRLYAYIGCQLRAAALAAPSIIRAQGPYAAWIKEYSSDGFLELPASKEALLDDLGTEVPYGRYEPASLGLLVGMMFASNGFCWGCRDRACASPDLSRVVGQTSDFRKGNLKTFTRYDGFCCFLILVAALVDCCREISSLTMYTSLMWVVKAPRTVPTHDPRHACRC